MQKSADIKYKPLTINNVYFVYTDVNNAQTKYVPEGTTPRTPLSDHPKEDQQYKVAILIPDSVYRKLAKLYKSAINIEKAKEYLTPEEAVTTYKLTEEEASKHEEWACVNFALPYLTGKPNNRVPVEKIEVYGVCVDKETKKEADMLGNEIVKGVDIGNGTKGHLQILPFKHTFGLSLRPVGIGISELVTYAGLQKVDITSEKSKIQKVVVGAVTNPASVEGDDEDDFEFDIAETDDIPDEI